MTQAVATHGIPPGQETADAVALGTDESVGGSGMSVATAFRRVEKRYQLKRDQVFRRRNGRRYCSGMVARPADLSDVLDLRLLPGLDTCAAPAFTPQEEDSLTSMTSADGFPTVSSVSAIADKVGADIVRCADDSSSSSSGSTVVSFAAFPGLHILPGFLKPEDQRELAVMCLEEFPEPPSHSNHTVHLGPLQGLWGAARSGLRLHAPRKGKKQETTARCTGEERREGGVSVVESSGAELGRHPVCRDSYDGRCWCRDGSGKTAASCLDKLRWVTIGPQYDWTQRVYDSEGPYQPVPELLAQLSRKASAIALEAERGRGLPGWQRAFSPDAALVNYYGEGDTLNGHVDDVEPDQSMPIVSISLGCPAILLMGRETLDAPPAAILVRGGDVVVLAGKARMCYHGVPRVFARGWPKELETCASDDARALELYMTHKRINLSVRTIT